MRGSKPHDASDKAGMDTSFPSDAFSRLRIGHGFDVHAFAKNRALILGGLEIDYDFGLEGHSDADVVLHSIMDALLGAARLGDIGDLFPCDDPTYEGACSLDLLKEVGKLLEKHKFTILDIDSVIAAQAPKIAPHKDKMRLNTARALNIDIDKVGLKATTTEQLGFVGRQEGIAASATCLLIRED